jgi:pimeloyl-[acyl-carrier protein] methyl ester esterase
LPGYGLNFQRLLIPYNLQIVTIAVAQHIPANCILIGWSLGGLVAQQIAHSYPEKLKQMVLICSSPKFSKSADWPSIVPKVLSFFTQQLNIACMAKTLERFLAIQAMGSVNARQDAKIIKKVGQQYPLPSLVALAAGLNMLQSIDLRE